MVRPRRVKGRVLKQRDWHRTPKKMPARRVTEEEKARQQKLRRFAYWFLGGIFAVLLLILFIKKIAG